MNKPMVFGFCSIGGQCKEWYLGTLAVSVAELRVPSSGICSWWFCLQILNQGNPSLNSMGGKLANFRFSLYEICVHESAGA